MILNQAFHKILILLVTLVLIGCVGFNCISYDLSLIDPYSYELEDKEPFDGPFLSHFISGEKELTYVAAYHENETGSNTFSLIDQALSNYNPKIIILEGFENSYGISPSDLISEFRKSSSNNFYKDGEVAYTALEAVKLNIPFIGGEPDEKYILSKVLQEGYTVNDLLGFYFTRQIPQIIRNGSLEQNGIKTEFKKFIAAAESSFGLQKSYFFTYDQFLEWYKVKSKKPFDLKTFDYEEVAPIKDGQFFTQRISNYVSLVRDRYIVQVVVEMLNKYQKVLIVYGKSHMATQRRSIEKILGKPVVVKRGGA